MIIAISISRQHLYQLERIAKECYPKEACALLEGTMTTINDKLDHEQANVLAVLCMRNADESIHSFRIDPNDLIRAYREIGSRNREVVGIFHSHASEAYPSLTDRRYMELNPVVWLIYSTLSNRFAAFIIDGVIVQVNLES
jgi:proteasome lid subunit RPN8/RPN11